MKILKELIEHANKTLETVEEYAQEAYKLKSKHKNLADAYFKISESNMGNFTTLHEKIIMLVEEEKNKNVEIPKWMEELYADEHRALIKKFAEIKYLMEEYKRI